MTRVPKDRETQLTRQEIVVEALRQYDQAGGEPSIRGLAAALRVSPSAIYNHFPSREAIIRAAVRRVWGESLHELLEIVPQPFEADPRDVLVACGVATRRAWLAHYRLTPYLAASPEVDEFTGDGVGLMANLMEQIGLTGEAAAAAFHSYMSFMIGSILFTAARMVTNDRLAGDGHRGAERRFRTEHRDEEQFIDGMRKLVASLTAPE